MAANIRVRVDWDADGYCIIAGTPTDSPNLIPDATSWGTSVPQAYNGGSGSLTFVGDDEYYGTRNLAVDLGAAAGDGVRLTALPELTPGVAYRLTFWYTKNSPGQVHAYIHDNLENLLAMEELDETSTFVPVTLNFTMPSGGITLLVLTNATGGGTVNIRGLMITSGALATPVHYNTGVPSLYENISNWVQQVDTDSGMTGAEELFPQEGVADIVITNHDRIFSPEYVDGPLYGCFQSNLLVMVDIEVDGVWQRLWSGWTESFNVDAGMYSERLTTIHAVQGVFSFNQSIPNTGLLRNVTSGSVVRQLLARYRSPNNPYRWILGASRLGQTTVIQGVDDSVVVDPGQTTFALIGDTWAEGDADKLPAIQQVITDITQVENGFCWIDRLGRVIWHDRAWASGVVANPPPWNLGTEAQAPQYQYDLENLVNSVKVVYHPRTYLNGTFWADTTQHKVAAGDSFEIHADFPGYTRYVVLSVDLVNTEVVLSAGAVDIVVTLVSPGDMVVRLTNSGEVEAIVTGVSVAGEAYLIGQAEEATAFDSASIEAYGVKSRRVENELIENQSAADVVALGQLLRFSAPLGLFDDTPLVSRTDWLARILEAEIGTVWSVTEYQTGVTANLMMVYAERHTWKNGLLSSTVSLLPLHNVVYWKVGSSRVGQTTVVAY